MQPIVTNIHDARKYLFYKDDPNFVTLVSNKLSEISNFGTKRIPNFILFHSMYMCMLDYTQEECTTIAVAENNWSHFKSTADDLVFFQFICSHTCSRLVLR